MGEIKTANAVPLNLTNDTVHAMQIFQIWTLVETIFY